MRVDSERKCNYIVAMDTTLIKIGNSRGIRLPKPIIDQCGFVDKVEIEVLNHKLVISTPNHSRSGWNSAFSKMSDSGDDELLDRVAEPGPTWDNEEWEW